MEKYIVLKRGDDIISYNDDTKEYEELLYGMRNGDADTKSYMRYPSDIFGRIMFVKEECVLVSEGIETQLHKGDFVLFCRSYQTTDTLIHVVIPKDSGLLSDVLSEVDKKYVKRYEKTEELDECKGPCDKSKIND